MEMNKKSGGGDVRAFALSWDGEREKAENVFFALSLSRPRWLAVLATHIPRRPKKKPLRGKKVGFAEKKLRLTQKMEGGFIYGARHKSGQSYQFLNKKA